MPELARHALSLCLAGMLMAIGAVHLPAQTVTGTLVGTVSDPSGAPVPNATVTARNKGTNITKAATTDAQGNYTITYLPPGSYEAATTANGFRRSLVPDLTLAVDQVARVDFPLQLGEVAETVSVTASASLVSSETSSVGQVITSQQIVNLPLKGRTFFELAQLAPGVTPTAPGSFVANRRPMPGGLNAPAFQVGGARETSNGYLIDGVSAQDPHYLTPSIFPSVDAIREFRLLTNAYSAEYGRFAAQVNATTRSGTNQFHGVAYEFFRNQVLDANNFFGNFSGSERPPLRYNQFGATLGGPVTIPKLYRGQDRTFFFVNYEGTRVRRGRISQLSVPTAAQRAGDFNPQGFRGNRPIYDPATTRTVDGRIVRDPFPDNRIPADRITPFAREILRLYPEPNSAVATGNNYFTTLSDQSDNNQFLGRLDQQLSSRFSLFFRYALFDGVETSRSPIVQGGQFTDVRTHNLAFALLSTINPGTLHELRLGYNRPVYLILQEGANERDWASDLGLRNLLTDPLGWGVPQIGLAGFSGFGSDTNPTTQISNGYQIVNHLSLVRGAHTVKVGTDFRKTNYNDRSERFVRGAFSFQGGATADPQRTTSTGVSVADLLLGLPLTASGSGISVAGNFNGFSYAFFAQDDWRVNPRLTLNLGLRYDLNLRYTDVQNRLTFFDASYPGGRLLVGGSPRAYIPGVGLTDGPELPRGLLSPDKNNWQPRVGLAFRPFADNRTAVRAGYGTFFDTVELQDLRTFVRNPPFGGELSLRADSNANSSAATVLRITDLFPGIGSPAARPSVYSPNATYPDPYYQQWNAGVERELPGAVLLEVSYVGSKGTRLAQRNNYNQAFLSPDPSRPTPLASRRPFPLFGDLIRITENDANSTYHALLSKLERRFANGVSFLASYTFGKSLDGASLIDNQPRDLYNKRLNKGRSNADLRHRFVLSGTWELPFGPGKAWATRGVAAALLGGWQTNTILTVRSGFPFTVTVPGDPCLCAASGQTAQQAGDPWAGDVRRRERWFNPDAFVVPAAGTFGSSGRNILDGPGQTVVNLSVFRSVALTESVRLQFRAESFNLLNQTSFGQPAANVGTPTYGVIQSAADPRNIQLALKLVY